MARKPSIRYVDSGDSVTLKAPKGSWYFNQFCKTPNTVDLLVHVFYSNFKNEIEFEILWWDWKIPHVRHALTEGFQQDAPPLVVSKLSFSLMATLKAELRKCYHTLRHKEKQAAQAQAEASNWEEKVSEKATNNYQYEADPDPPVEAIDVGESETDYFDIPAASSSGLKEVIRSARHFWYKYRNPDAPPLKATDNMNLGTALHSLVLENKRNWRVMPEEGLNTKVGKALHAWVLEGRRLWITPPEGLKIGKSKAYLEWREAQPVDAIVLKDEEVEKLYDLYAKVPTHEGMDKLPLDALRLKPADIVKVEGMAQAIREHQEASKLVSSKNTELVMQWLYHIDDDTPVPCKGKLDCLLDPDEDGTLRIVDIKTTADASGNGFMRTIAQFKYHVQAAFYRDGLFANTGNRDIEFIFVVVESAPPYAVVVYLLSEEALDQGRREYVKALRTYAQCLKDESNLPDGLDPKAAWPAYNPPFGQIGLPRWAWDSETYRQFSD